MREITAKVFSASEISGDPSDTARITVVPSGYKGIWIELIEDIDYSISVKYVDPVKKILYGLED